MALTHAESMKRKETSLKELREKIASAKIAILTDYRGEKKGLTVKEVTDLRRKLRENKGEYRVFKNTLAKKVFNESKVAGLDEYLKNPIAIVFGFEDPSVTSKTLIDFVEEKKDRKLPEIKAGYMDGQLLTPVQLKSLASLPPKPVLLGNLVRTLNAPIQGLVNVLSGVPRNLVIALAEIQRKKEEAEKPAE